MPLAYVFYVFDIIRKVRLIRAFLTSFSSGTECVQYNCVSPNITISEPFVNENSY